MLSLPNTQSYNVDNIVMCIRTMLRLQIWLFSLSEVCIFDYCKKKQKKNKKKKKTIRVRTITQ